MTLFSISRVCTLRGLILKPFSFERLKKLNNLNPFPLIRSSIGDLRQWSQQTQDQYADLLLTQYFLDKHVDFSSWF